MLEGGIFEAVSSAAKEICFNSRLGNAGISSIFTRDLTVSSTGASAVAPKRKCMSLKDALKLFALEFFGCDKNSLTGRRILNGSFSDCKFYPREGDKLNVQEKMYVFLRFFQSF